MLYTENGIIVSDPCHWMTFIITFFFLKGISSKRVLHTERTCNTGTYYDDILRCGSYRKKFE